MSLDGIWSVEIGGIYGWERMSTAFFEKGRYLSGGPVMFSQGTYVVDGKKIKIKMKITQHGKKRIAYGEKLKHFSLVITAKRDGKKIKGEAHRKGDESHAFKYPVRFSKLADIPAFPK
jgi:hypothetical protein